MRLSFSSLCIIAVLAMASAPLHAAVLDAEAGTVSLSGVWALRVDDNPAWAAPDVDDSGWERLTVPGTWGPRTPTPGFAWLRTSIEVPWFDGSDEARARWARLRPSLAVLGEIGNAWELHAGGARVGGFGVVEGPLKVARPQVIPLPDSTVRNGRIHLAWRVWREPHLPHMDVTYAGMSGVAGDVVVGRADALQAMATATQAQRERQELAFGPLLAVLLLVGLYHLQLYRRRRALREYLWLGLLLLTIGVIGTLHTFWWDTVSLDLGWRVKVSVVGGFVVGPLFIEFVWPFLGRTVTRRWRLYQVVQLVAGTVTLVSPGLSLLVESTPLRSLLWLPWIVMTIAIVVVEARRKHPEARTMLGGLGVFVLSMVYLLLQNLGVIDVVGIGNGMAVFMFGATAFLLSMVLSLSNRFVRVYNSLDELNRDLEQTYRAAARFVPVDFMRLIGRQSVREVAIGDQVSMSMSILFCDVRGFTRLAEALGPERSFALINSYLRAMEPAIHGHHGFIRQYLGDGIMALFPGSADDAVAAAVDMVRALARFNVGRDQPLHIGVGINTGPIMLGTIGGQDRLDSGVVGDAVNLASRIEGMTKTYGSTILLGEATVAGLKDPGRFGLRMVDRVIAKGRAAALTITEVLDVLPAASQETRRHTAPLWAAAHEALVAGDFARAASGFQQVIDADATDEAARVLLARTTAFVEQPPAEWHGATALQSK
jgi:class 3 adenylate cyclase